MAFILASIGIFLLGGLCCLFIGNRPSAARAASYAVSAACLFGLAGVLPALFQNFTPEGFTPQIFILDFPLPLGSGLFRLDSLSLFFLLPLYFVAGLAGLTIPSQVRTICNHVHAGRHGFFFCLLLGALVLVLTAADGILFFVGWEVMSLAPFFLLCLPSAKYAKRAPSLTYFVAAHLGALPLLFLFANLTVLAGSSSFTAYAAISGAPLSLFFILALVGFSAKLGLVPFHGWMPEAYPAAPGHAAAVLSGVMVNAGVYGLMRMLSIFGSIAGGPGPAWWAYTLMGLGGFSGAYGIMQALAQPDAKKSLAYSSTENMGIICLALGAGLLVIHAAPEGGSALTATVGTAFFAGAIAHMFNHSLFKSLLFLGANAVEQRTGSTALCLMGGLLKRMPLTGAFFAVAAAAIAGLPPLNGFMGELLMYFGFLNGAAVNPGSGVTLIFWLGMFTLSGIAGLSLFTFARMFGIIFLGSPRSTEALEGREPRRPILFAMGCLAGLCLLAGVGAGFLFRLIEPAAANLGGAFGMTAHSDLPAALPVAQVLAWAGGAVLVLLLIILVVWLNQRRVRARNGFDTGLTWDCGYRAPSARIQYTGGAFAQMTLRFMAGFLRPRIETPNIQDLFPAPAKATIQSNDWLTSFWLSGVFRPVARLAAHVKAFQHGLLNAYILYILITLILCLIWALGVA